MKELIIVLVAIVLLTGVIHSLRYSNLIVNLVVGFTYFLGFVGLFSMYESLRYKDENRRWIILFFGFMSMLIAYFALEALFRSYGRM
jgi:uncharacterized membrane protein HdeD (DUF308 family)